MNDQEDSDRTSASKARRHCIREIVLVDTLLQEYAHDKEANGGVEEEQPELLVVKQANAVACPGTVMVHLHHTFSAQAAMMSARRLHHLALLAILKAIETCDVHDVEDVIFG